MRSMVTTMWTAMTGGATEAPPSVAPVESYVPAEPRLAAGRSQLVEVATLIGHEDRVWHVEWHPTGDILATCSGDKAVRLWSRCAADAATSRSPKALPAGDADRHWKCIQTLDGEHSRTVRCVSWSPDGERLACASFDGTVTVWRKASPQFAMEVESVLDGHDSEVKAVAWDHTGSLIATCSRDRSVWVYEREALEPMPGDDGDGDGDGAAGEVDFTCAGVLQGHAQDVKTVTWVPGSSRHVVSAGYDDVVKVWEESAKRKDDWHCVQTLVGHEGTVWGLAFQKIAASDAAAAEARVLVSGSSDCTLAVWRQVVQSTKVGGDAAAGGAEVQWQRESSLAGAHTNTVYSLDWAPVAAPPAVAAGGEVGDTRSSIVASGGADDGLCVSEMSLMASDDPSQGNVLILKTVVTAARAHQSDVNCVRFSPVVGVDAETARPAALLATAGDDNLIKLWRLVY
jgi:WD40 repeat protein